MAGRTNATQAAPSVANRSKRPFWMHQAVEYLLGGVLVAQGLQSLTPVPPAVAGGLIMVNAAIVRGPLAAFRLVGRTLHRALDLAVIATIVVMVVQPAIEVEAGARLVMAAIAFLMSFVWWQTDFTEKAPRRARAASGATPASEGRSSEVGRMAGRALGDGVNMVRRFRKPGP